MKVRHQLKFILDFLFWIDQTKKRAEFIQKANLDSRGMQKNIPIFEKWGFVVKNSDFFILTDEGMNLMNLLMRCEPHNES